MVGKTRFWIKGRVALDCGARLARGGCGSCRLADVVGAGDAR